MPKSIITFVLFLALVNKTFSQPFEQKRVEFKDGHIKNSLKAYVGYAKGFAERFNLKSYIITLEQQSNWDSSTFSIRLFYSSNFIFSFNPSFYTVVDGTPVIIRTGLEGYLAVPDTNFFGFIRETYFKKETEKEKLLVGSINSNNTSSNSVTVLNTNLKKAVKHPSSDFVKVDFKDWVHYPMNPKECILKFMRRMKFVQETWTEETQSQ